MELPALVEKVQNHLSQVRNDPNHPLDQKLLEHVNKQVTGMCRHLSNKHSDATLELLRFH